MDKQRRKALVASAGAVAGMATLGTEADAQPAITASVQKLNQQKAVMPDGKVLSREAILKKLGIDPSVVADKWLTIGCGVNASAAPTDRIKQLIKTGAIKQVDLDRETQLKIGR